MLNGDFTFNGIGDPVYDPASLTRLVDGSYSRTAFPGNRVPRDRFDPATRKFLSLQPWFPANNRSTTVMNRTGPTNNFSADTRNRSYRTAMDWKVDHNLSDSHRIVGRGVTRAMC